MKCVGMNELKEWEVGKERGLSGGMGMSEGMREMGRSGEKCKAVK
jgi:hypothetical protein